MAGRSDLWLRKMREEDTPGCSHQKGCFRGHSKPEGSTGLRLGQTLSHDTSYLASRARVVTGCKMDPCFCLLPLARARPALHTQQTAVYPGRALLGDVSHSPKHLHLLSCLSSAPPPPGESSLTRQQEMGLPVPCASPGSKNEQQVARLPSSSVGAHVYVLSTQWEEKCMGVGGDACLRKATHLGPGVSARQTEPLLDI